MTFVEALRRIGVWRLAVGAVLVSLAAGLCIWQIAEACADVRFLTVSVQGVGRVTTSVSTLSVDGSASVPGQRTYACAPGVEVTLTASALSSAWFFDHWDSDPPSTSTKRVTMDGDTNVTAVFKSVISFQTNESTVSESVGTTSVIVNRPGTGVATTVSYAVSGSCLGTGSHVDYILKTGTLSFAASDTSKPITFDILNDLLDEEDIETIVVTLTGASNGVIGTANIHTIKVTDNDPLPSLQWSSSASLVSETTDLEGVETRIICSLSALSGREVSANYSIANTSAEVGIDYTSSGAPLTFSPGQIQANVPIRVLYDALDEEPESICLTLGAPTNATLAAPTSHVLTIGDDDPPPTIQFVNTANEMYEADSDVMLALDLQPVSGKAVTLNYTVTGTARGGGRDFSIGAGQLEIPAGGTGSIPIHIVDDLIYESNETIVVHLTSATNAEVGPMNTYTLTIADNDPAPTVEFMEGQFEPLEAIHEDHGNVLLLVSLTGDTESIATVDYSIATTAQWGGVELSAKTGTVTFDPDAFFSNIGLIRVPLVDDDVHGDLETVTVTLSNPQNARLGEYSELQFSVFDDDPLPRMRFAEPSSEVNEGPQTIKTISAVLNRPSANDVTAWITVAGSAMGYGVDYLMANQSIEFSPGECSASVQVTIADDLLNEAPETIVLSLCDPRNTETIPPTSHTVTIVDNDPLPGVYWSHANMDVYEAAGSLQIPFELSNISGREVAVYFTHTAQTGDNPEYAFAPCPVRVPAGTQNGVVTLTIGQDAVIEPTETISVNLVSHAESYATPAAPVTCQIAVLDGVRLTLQPTYWYGTITPTPPGPLHARNSIVSLQAQELPGYRFADWTGAASGTDNPVQVLMDSDKSVGAHFIRQFKLTPAFYPAGAGTATLDPEGGEYDAGTYVTLTAVPAPHYRFSSWLEDTEDGGLFDTISTVPEVTVRMTKDRSTLAVFAHQYALTTTAYEGGTLTPSSGGFDDNTEVELNAVALPGYEFLGWAGPVYDVVGRENPSNGRLSSQAKVRMDADKQVEAFFSYGYTLAISSRGSGSVIGADVYTPFTQATLYPVAGLGWHFDHWEGDLTGSSNPATLDMNTSKTVTAVFVEDPQSAPVADPVVTINTVAVGHGRVDPTERRLGRIFLYSDSSPTGLPEPVTFFTAIPDPGARFDHWEGMIEGTDNPGFLWSVYPGTALAYPYYVTAVFVDVCNVDVSTEGEGAVSPGTGQRDLGQPSTFTATPAPGYRLHHWLVNGQVAGGDPTLTITPTADTTVVAVFTPVAALTLVAMPSGAGGSITADPLKDVYDPGDHVSLLAAPAAAWRFYRWEKNGAYAGHDNPLPLTLQEDTTVAAWFVQTFEYTATATAGGSVYPTHKTCDIGTTVAATATPDAGLVFVRWDGDVPENLRYQRHIVLAMDQNRAIQPVFGYALTASILGGGAIRIGEATAPLVTDAQTLRHIPLGQEVSLTAVDTENATFLYWIMPNGAHNASASIQRLTLSANSTFSAVFEPAETSPAGNFSLAVAVNGQGKVTVNAQGDKAVRNYGVFSYAPSSSVALTATPDEGYVFSHWSGDATGPDASLCVAMDGPKAVTAHFHAVDQTTTPEGNDLSVRVIGGGTVVSNGWWFAIPGEDEEPPLAIVIAKPNFGWRFDHWEGDSTDTLNITGAIMNADRSLTAVFVPGLTLDVSAIVAGGNVYVGAEEDWIPEMPDALNAGFASGQEAQFTAVPQDGWEFDHWIGLPEGQGSSVSIAMSGHLFVQPVFVPLYPVSVVNTPGGTVTVTEDGTPNAPVSNTALFSRRPGTTFTLTATPNPGWYLDGWDGPVQTSVVPPLLNTATLSVSEPALVVPRFRQEEYTVITSASIPEGVELVMTPEKEHYHYGEVLEVSAFPKPGYRFAGWALNSLPCTLGNPCRIVIRSSLSITAQIEGDYHLNLFTSSAGGTVSAVPELPSYCPGQEVTITASPYYGFSFEKWEGDISGTSNSIKIRMDSNKRIGATFNECDELATLAFGVFFVYPSGGNVRIDPVPDSLTISEAPGYWWYNGSFYTTLHRKYACSYTRRATSVLTENPFDFPITFSIEGSPSVPHHPGWCFTTESLNENNFPKYTSPGQFETQVSIFLSSLSQIGTFGYGVRVSKRFEYCRPIQNYNPLLRPGGLITFHKDGEGILLYGLQSSGRTYRGVTDFIAPLSHGIVRKGTSFGDVSACPSPGWRCTGWTGTDRGQEVATTAYRLRFGGLDDGDIDLTAHFEPITKYCLQLSAYPVNAGNTQVSPYAEDYGKDQQITVIASPSEGWVFKEWRMLSTLDHDGIPHEDGELISISPSCMFRIAQDSCLRAVFEPAPHELRVRTVGDGSVERTPNAVTYTHGSTVTLTPQPAPGWEFHCWEGDLTGSDTPATLTMDGPKQVTAIFKPILNLSVDINNNGSDTDDEEFEPGGSKEDEAPSGEYIRSYNQIDNGIGYGALVTMATLSGLNSIHQWISRCDDVQPVRLSLGESAYQGGVVSVRVTQLEGTPPVLHYLPSEHVEKSTTPWGAEFVDEIEFPYNLESRGPLPKTIYILAEGPATGYSKFLLTVEYDPGISGVPSGEDTLCFTSVSGIGAPHYFAAVNDYLKETGSKLFIDRKTYTPEMVNNANQAKLATAAMTMQFVIMDESRTRLTVVDAFSGGDFVYGIKNVAKAHSDQTVVTSGNFAWDVRAQPSWYGIPSWANTLVPGPCYARRCRGLVVSGNRVLEPSTYESDFPLEQRFPKNPKYIAQMPEVNGVAPFIFGAGNLEDVQGHDRSLGVSPYRDAMGGVYGPNSQEAVTYGDNWMSYSGGPSIVVGEVCDVEGSDNYGQTADADTKLLFTAASEFLYFSRWIRVSVYAGRKGAGTDLMNSGASQLLFLDGDSSVALAYKNNGGNGSLQAKIVGMRHRTTMFPSGLSFTKSDMDPRTDGRVGLYHLPTYLMFKVN